MTSGLDRLERFVLGALAYLTLSGIWIYGVLDSSVLDGRQVGGWTAVGVVVLAHIAFGYAIREWVALLCQLPSSSSRFPRGFPSRTSSHRPFGCGRPFSSWSGSR